MSSNGSSKPPSRMAFPDTPPDFMIFHISDLHFGGELYPQWMREDAPLVKAGPPLYTYIPLVREIVTGLYPHDPSACMELENLIANQILERQPGRVLLVVSGDLTALGFDSEFAIALSYLRSRLQTSWSDSLGLGGLGMETLVVAGNHDHALGSKRSHIVQHAAPLYGQYLPNERAWLRAYTHGSLRLEVAGLDTCGSERNQLLARGRLDRVSLGVLNAALSKTAEASKNAAKGTKKPLRLLVCHHSPSSSSWTTAPGSANQIKKLCDTHDIHFVLCGHTHDIAVPASGSTHQMGTELRCGTTLQGSPPNCVPNKDGNTLLIHSIWGSEGADGVIWRTVPYQRLLYRNGQAVGVHFRPVGGRAYQTEITL